MDINIYKYSYFTNIYIQILSCVYGALYIDNVYMTQLQLKTTISISKWDTTSHHIFYGIKKNRVN